MKKSYMKYILGLLLFGSNGVVASAIALSSYEIVLLRSVIGGALLVILFLISGNHFTVLRHKRDLGFILLSGIAMAADWLFLFEAYAQIGVSLGMLINYCGPAIVIVLSPLMLQEKLKRSKVAALLAALAGAFLISGQAVVSGLSIWGLFCAVMSAVSYAVMVLANKLAKEVDRTENAVLQLLGTALTVAVFVGCFFYFSSIGQLPAQSVAVCGYIEPLTAVILSVVILHENMTGWQILGAGMIIGGALYGELKSEAGANEAVG